jgi:hypothetical protein
MKPSPRRDLRDWFLCSGLSGWRHHPESQVDAFSNLLRFAPTAPFQLVLELALRSSRHHRERTMREGLGEYGTIRNSLVPLLRVFTRVMLRPKFPLRAKRD